MAGSRTWRIDADEKLTLGVSLAGDIESGALLNGTPQISVWSVSNGMWTDQTSNFTIDGEQVNTVELTTESGETIAIGKGVTFNLTASSTPGEYKVRVECDADDSTLPVTTRALLVLGPGAPA